MNKTEILALIILFLIASSGMVYMMYSEDIGKAWFGGKRISISKLDKLVVAPASVPTAAPAPPAPTPVPAPTLPSTEPRCADVIINGPPEDKINVIFIGINYADNSLFEQHVNLDIDWNGQNYGLFSVEPYKTYKEQFNFYRIDYTSNTFDCLGKDTPTACGGVPYESIRAFVKQICGDKLLKGIETGMIAADPFIEVLINEPNQGNAGWSPIGQGVSLMWSSGVSEEPAYRQVFTHELGGHALAGLQDEYRGTPKDMPQTFCSHQYCQQFLQAIGYGGDRPEEQASNCDKAGCTKWANLLGQDGIDCVNLCGGYEDLYHPTKCQIIVDQDGNPVRKTEIGKDNAKYLMKCNIMDKPTGVVTGRNNQGEEWNVNPKEIDSYTYQYFDLVAQTAIRKQIQRLIKYPLCSQSEPECEKAVRLFKLIPPVKTPGGYIQGVFDKEKKFTLHQFGIVYDALTSLPADLMSALKLLVFSPHPTLGSGANSIPETGEVYLGYRTDKYLQTDKALFCVVIHEMGHLIETNKNVEKSFRSICYDRIGETWQRKSECEIYLDFAPQLVEDNWNTELRARSAGGDGREDIPNAFEYYVCAGDLFRAEARARPKMKEKYLFLKDRLFNGKEYKCEIDSCLTLVPPPTPCGSNGCASCKKTGDPCITACNDCPAIAGCGPGGCKQWTCTNNQCIIAGQIK